MVDRYRNYQPTYYRPRDNRRSPKKPRRKLFFIAVLLISTIFISKQLNKPEPTPAAAKQPEPKSEVKKTKSITVDPIDNTDWKLLEVKINEIIAANPNVNIAVAVIDLKTNTRANYGLDEPFHGASTTKVITAAAYLNHVETGSRTLNEPIAGRPANEHLKLMINRSNNESWAALNSAVGYKQLTTYGQSIGASSFDYYGNTITAADQATVLQKLYTNQLLNKEHTKLLLGFMQQTNNETMLPSVLPSGANIYHKYGQFEDRQHDTGIIEYNNRPLVLTIYTKGGATDGSIYASRTALIQTIAQTVYSIFYKL